MSANVTVKKMDKCEEKAGIVAVHRGKRHDIDAETWKELILAVRMLRNYSEPATPLQTIGMID